MIHAKVVAPGDRILCLLEMFYGEIENVNKTLHSSGVNFEKHIYTTKELPPPPPPLSSPTTVIAWHDTRLLLDKIDTS